MEFIIVIIAVGIPLGIIVKAFYSVFTNSKMLEPLKQCQNEIIELYEKYHPKVKRLGKQIGSGAGKAIDSGMLGNVNRIYANSASYGDNYYFDMAFDNFRPEYYGWSNEDTTKYYELSKKYRNARVEYSKYVAKDPTPPITTSKPSAAKSMVKGAIVGGIIGGDAGAVVGAMVAKEKYDSANKK